MKPMATGHVTIRLPLLDVEEEFVRGLGADDTTVIERTAGGDFRAVSKAGIARVVQEFRLEASGDAATEVHAAIWVQPAALGWLMRRVMGRRRLQEGVDRALSGMASRATGEPEFGPEDFLDEEEVGPA
jgi:hypothetical protein